HYLHINVARRSNCHSSAAAAALSLSLSLSRAGAVATSACDVGRCNSLPAHLSEMRELMQRRPALCLALWALAVHFCVLGDLPVCRALQSEASARRLLLQQEGVNNIGHDSKVDIGAMVLVVLVVLAFLLALCECCPSRSSSPHEPFEIKYLIEKVALRTSPHD
ncbi:hypothetical protein GOP47_0016016, partial [Adiantum capillus-veneris]